MKIEEINEVAITSAAFIEQLEQGGCSVERVTVRVRDKHGPRADVVVTRLGNVSVQPQRAERSEP